MWLSPDEAGEYRYGSGQDAVNWAWVGNGASAGNTTEFILQWIHDRNYRDALPYHEFLKRQIDFLLSRASLTKNEEDLLESLLLHYESPIFDAETLAVISMPMVVGESINNIWADSPSAIQTAVIKQRILEAGSQSPKGARGSGQVSPSGSILTARSLALRFYQKAGYSTEEASKHIRGIDFTKPVNQRLLQPGMRLMQYQRVSDGTTPIQGSYYTLEGTPIGKIGMDPTKYRYAGTYMVVKPVDALQSTAADFDGFKGGAIQYFIPDKSALFPVTVR